MRQSSGSDPTAPTADHSGKSKAELRTPNRLADQTSPYLLQHARNPVDWWPWGEAAFDEARRRDVPILLSVGYSTCYWCHVMERESFEDAAAAREMNSRFVCIKLDREEHPEIDDVYMTALVLMTGRGGWPMNVFLEPATLKPFWCGTYFPPEPRMNLPAWTQVLERISSAWSGQRADVIAQARRVADGVHEHLSPNAFSVADDRGLHSDVGQAQVTQALSQLLASFDRTEGGFGPAPKFPQPALLEFLLTVRPLASDDPTRNAIDESLMRTLSRMACGGMFDQAGGGFHRYSVDGRWIVPHFEKMLYDNAQLARVYALASVRYGDEFFAGVAARILDYTLREMNGPAGGFFAAQDAEVDGREGHNYLWTAEELRAVLEPADADFATRIYGLDQGPNFHDPHHPGLAGGNVLRLVDRPDRLARDLNSSVPEFLDRLTSVNRSLYAARLTRRQPRLDDKAVASWNGLMIGALASGSVALGQPRFLAAAERTAGFLRSEMWDGATLFRTWRNGQRGTEGVLEDYACVIAGVLELVDATVEANADPAAGRRALAWAEQLAHAAHSAFSDAAGRYFDTRDGRTDMFVRTSSTSDGALPSGLSIMLNALLTLGRSTGNAVYVERAGRLLRGMGRAIADSPVGTINAVRAVARILTEPQFEAIARSLSTSDRGDSTSWPQRNAPFLPVEVYASVDRLALGRDRPGLLRLVLRVADGYHVIAAQPSVDPPSEPGREIPSLAPLRVNIVGGSGVGVYADYPAGEPLGVPHPTSEVRSGTVSRSTGPLVYHGTVEFDVALEREGAWAGRPMLALTYQACGETECQPVRTVELDVALDPE